MNKEQIDIEKILFLDIETVSQNKTFDELNDAAKKLWTQKASYLIKDEETPANIYGRAGIYAEFGKIICISVGFAVKQSDSYQIRIKSFYGDDEKKLLTEFSEMLENNYQTKIKTLCAHNGKEFDFPYICRRLLINRLPIPRILDIGGKKPWEIELIDTLEMWKFGDYKNYTSLALLAHIFDIPTPKDDIDGSQVGDVYWKENNLSRIVEYCQKDVITIIQLYLSYKGLPLITKNQIVIA
jgi:3'-5' exonuclease